MDLAPPKNPWTLKNTENRAREVRPAAYVFRRPGYTWMLLEKAGDCREVTEKPRTMPASQPLLVSASSLVHEFPQTLTAK